MLLYRHTAVLLYWHTAVLPNCYTAVLLYWHTAVLPHCHTAVLSYCHTAVLPYCYAAVLPHCHTAVLPYCYTAILPYCCTANFTHMKFSPKCNTKSDIGKFAIKFGNFCSLWEKQGPITGPKFALGKSLVFVLEVKQNKQLSKSFYLLYWFQFNKQITYINIMMQTINIMPKV